MSELVEKIPKGWIEANLSKYVDLLNHKKSIDQFHIHNYISTENLLPNKQGVTESSGLPKSGKANSFKIGDTLFSNIRTYFKKVWLSKFKGGCSGDVIVFRPKKNNRLSSKFLYYVISNDDFIEYTVKTARGTKMPRGDKSAIKQYSIKIPSEVNEQIAIADILSAFDQKIELLQEQNKTLENLAQTLFKEWFGKYQVGDQLPEGWRPGKLGEEFKIIMGQSPKGTSYNEEGKGTLFFQGRAEFKSRFPQKRLFTTEPKRMAQKFDVLVSVRAPVGDINVASESCCIGRGLAAVRGKNKSYTLYQIKALKNKFDLFESEGTVFGSINKKSFSNIQIVVPPKELVEKFEDFANKFDLKYYSNSEQIQTLKKTRDTLLPKLMNGSVRVKEFQH